MKPTRRRSGRPRVAVLAALVAVVLAGCGPTGEPELRVSRAQAAEPTAGSSQIVVEITNEGDGDDRLVAAETDAAVGIELHLTTIEDDRATMSQLDEVEIPAGETVRFRPGGLHLMMIAPDEAVTRGGTFELTLRFARSDEVVVPVEVVELLDLAESTFDDPDV